MNVEEPTCCLSRRLLNNLNFRLKCLGLLRLSSWCCRTSALAISGLYNFCWHSLKAPLFSWTSWIAAVWHWIPGWFRSNRRASPWCTGTSGLPPGWWIGGSWFFCSWWTSGWSLFPSNHKRHLSFGSLQYGNGLQQECREISISILLTISLKIVNF